MKGGFFAPPSSAAPKRPLLSRVKLGMGYNEFPKRYVIMLNASQICRCQDLFLLQKMTIKMQNTYNFVCVCFFFWFWKENHYLHLNCSKIHSSL